MRPHLFLSQTEETKNGLGLSCLIDSLSGPPAGGITDWRCIRIDLLQSDIASLREVVIVIGLANPFNMS
jgi:hypothetical protein